MGLVSVRRGVFGCGEGIESCFFVDGVADEEE